MEEKLWSTMLSVVKVELIWALAYIKLAQLARENDKSH